MRAMLWITVLTLACVGTARADDAADLKAAAKKLKGTWRCDGDQFDPTGTAWPARATIKWKLDLDKAWLRGDVTMKKSKGMKRAYRAVQYRSVTNGAWTQVSLSNVGGTSTEHAAAPGADGALVWDGQTTIGGATLTTRVHEGPGDKAKTIHLWAEVDTGGGSFVKQFDVTCRK